MAKIDLTQKTGGNYTTLPTLIQLGTGVHRGTITSAVESTPDRDYYTEGRISVLIENEAKTHASWYNIHTLKTDGKINGFMMSFIDTLFTLNGKELDHSKKEMKASEFVGLSLDVWVKETTFQGKIREEVQPVINIFGDSETEFKASLENKTLTVFGNALKDTEWDNIGETLAEGASKAKESKPLHDIDLDKPALNEPTKTEDESDDLF